MPRQGTQSIGPGASPSAHRVSLSVSKWRRAQVLTRSQSTPARSDNENHSVKLCLHLGTLSGHSLPSCRRHSRGGRMLSRASHAVSVSDHNCQVISAGALPHVAKRQPNHHGSQPQRRAAVTTAERQVRDPAATTPAGRSGERRSGLRRCRPENRPEGSVR
jgi:hypothetical protein